MNKEEVLDTKKRIDEIKIILQTNSLSDDIIESLVKELESILDNLSE